MAVGMLSDGGVRGRLSPLFLAIALSSLAGCGGESNGGMAATAATPPSMTPPPTTSTQPPTTTPPPTSTPPPTTTLPPTTTPPPITTSNTPGAGSWHTSGNEIRDINNLTVRMTGVNWYGFETTDHLAHGLWAQDYKSILNTIQALGYNVIRIPFSNEMVEENPVPTHFTTSVSGTAANAALVGQTALDDLDTLVAYAGSMLTGDPRQSPLGSRGFQ
jgi:hypothetical protein